MAKTLQEELQETYLQMRGILSEEDNQIITEILALDELSKKTLGSYINKASNSAAMAWGKHKTAEAGAEEVSRFTNRHMNDKFKSHDKIKDMIGASNKEIEKHRETAIKRIHGISKATSRLTKEQKETIEGILEELEEAEDLEENYVVHNPKTGKIKHFDIKSIKTANQHAEKLGGDYIVSSKDHWNDNYNPSNKKKD